MDKEKIAIYDALIALCPDIERKGKTMLYTSANGYMFSQLNKAGEIGIRLPKDQAAAFLEKYDSGPFKSYGATMKDYVLAPENLLEDLPTLANYLQASHDYVMRLPPK